MLAKEAIVAFLAHKHVEYVFHLPGVHSLPLNQGLAGPEVRGIMGRHESSAAFAARVIANGPTPANISRMISLSFTRSRTRWRSVESRAEK